MRRILGLLIVVVITTTACGSGDTDAEGPLVVYSGRGEELVGELLTDFETESGIELDIRYEGSTELAATLIEEGDSTEADVFFAQDPASLGSVTGLMSVLPDQVLSSIDPRFQDRGGRWVGVSGRVRVLVYNTETEIELPQTIDDVLGPEWTGTLGVAPTNASFLAFVAAMILERGEEGTRDWLEALAANQPVDFESNTPIVEATDTGEIAGGLVNHYYLLRRRAEGLGTSAENYFLPAGDVGSLVMPAGVGIIEQTDQPEAARELVDFLLSDQAQQYFAEVTYEYPLRESVAAPDGVPPLSEINAPDIDLSRLAEVLDTATRLVAEAGLV